MKALALDFDGVISDSATESFIVALRTYVSLCPDSSLSDAARELVVASAERVRAHPLHADFVELMPLGNRAEDFGVALHMLEHELAVPDQTAYDALRRAHPGRFLEMFHRRFYEERARMRADDPAGWQALLAPYPAFVALIRRRAGDVILALATAKDRRSVDVLLRAYGIADLFAPECVLDKETGASKRAHLTALASSLGLEFPQITFVDDKVNHLEDVAGLGVRCALAAWGYNGARERAIARASGHLVVELGDAEAALFDSA